MLIGVPLHNFKAHLYSRTGINGPIEQSSDPHDCPLPMILAHQVGVISTLYVIIVITFGLTHCTTLQLQSHIVLVCNNHIAIFFLNPNLSKDSTQVQMINVYTCWNDLKLYNNEIIYLELVPSVYFLELNQGRSKILWGP